MKDATRFLNDLAKRRRAPDFKSLANDVDEADSPFLSAEIRLKDVGPDDGGDHGNIRVEGRECAHAFQGG